MAAAPDPVLVESAAAMVARCLRGAVAALGGEDQLGPRTLAALRRAIDAEDGAALALLDALARAGAERPAHHPIAFDAARERVEVTAVATRRPPVEETRLVVEAGGAPPAAEEGWLDAMLGGCAGAGEPAASGGAPAEAAPAAEKPTIGAFFAAAFAPAAPEKAPPTVRLKGPRAKVAGSAPRRAHGSISIPTEGDNARNRSNYDVADLAYLLRAQLGDKLVVPGDLVAYDENGDGVVQFGELGAIVRDLGGGGETAAHEARAIYDCVDNGAGQESEIPNFKGSFLGRFPLVSADFWTSDHLSGRSRSVDALSGTRARGTLTLKRR